MSKYDELYRRDDSLARLVCRRFHRLLLLQASLTNRICLCGLSIVNAIASWVFDVSFHGRMPFMPQASFISHVQQANE